MGVVCRVGYLRMGVLGLGGILRQSVRRPDAKVYARELEQLGHPWVSFRIGGTCWAPVTWSGPSYEKGNTRTPVHYRQNLGHRSESYTRAPVTREVTPDERITEPDVTTSKRRPGKESESLLGDVCANYTMLSPNALPRKRPETKSTPVNLHALPKTARSPSIALQPPVWTPEKNQRSTPTDRQTDLVSPRRTSEIGARPADWDWLSR